jgi:antitoxin (DNA-binding transcriptional repressor) of toxin-antitoxin stability system
LAEASVNPPHFVEMATQGEEIVIVKDEQSVVKLSSITTTSARPQFGSAKGLVWMSDDFDEPLGF